MRRRVQHEGLTVNVVVGTHVVFFGMDLDLRQRGLPGEATLPARCRFRNA